MKIIRYCSLCLAALVMASLLVPGAAAAGKGKYLVYVGTYTRGASKGIYAFRFDAASGKLEPIGLAGETPNPSFVAIHPNHRYLYAVSEMGGFQGQPSGAVSAFSIDPTTARLTFLNKVSSKGSGPCYVIVDKSGKSVLVANYNSGSVAAFPVEADGKLGESSSFIQHAGSSVNAQRQAGPHAHSINPSPDNRFAIAADLGLDEVLVYRFDAARSTITPNDPPFTKVAAGSGPRHFVFHPGGRFAYVINEMASTVTAFSYDKARGVLKELQTISTLPKDFSGENSTAEVRVHPSGRFLYGSNRGHDSIAVFTIDPKKGTLTAVEQTPTQGKTPRNFNLDPSGSFLLAANQDSDNITVFRIDKATGRLTPAGQQVEAPSPVCIRFMAVK